MVKILICLVVYKYPGVFLVFCIFLNQKERYLSAKYPYNLVSQPFNSLKPNKFSHFSNQPKRSLNYFFATSGLVINIMWGLKKSLELT